MSDLDLDLDECLDAKADELRVWITRAGCEILLPYHSQSVCVPLRNARPVGYAIGCQMIDHDRCSVVVNGNAIPGWKFALVVARHNPKRDGLRDWVRANRPRIPDPMPAGLLEILL